MLTRNELRLLSLVLSEAHDKASFEQAKRIQTAKMIVAAEVHKLDEIDHGFAPRERTQRPGD